MITAFKYSKLERAIQRAQIVDWQMKEKKMAENGLNEMGEMKAKRNRKYI